jgi:hypothetical protein
MKAAFLLAATSELATLVRWFKILLMTRQPLLRRTGGDWATKGGDGDGGWTEVGSTTTSIGVGRAGASSTSIIICSWLVEDDGDTDENEVESPC